MSRKSRRILFSAAHAILLSLAVVSCSGPDDSSFDNEVQAGDDSISAEAQTSAATSSYWLVDPKGNCYVSSNGVVSQVTKCRKNFGRWKCPSPNSHCQVCTNKRDRAYCVQNH
jgi:hypothetical protein